MSAGPSTLLLVGVGGLAVLVAALLFLSRPPVTRLTVLAFVPYMVIAAALNVLGSLGAYPPIYSPILRTPFVLVTAFVIAGTAWFVLLQLLTSGRALEALPVYFGAIGVGTAWMLVTFLVVDAGVRSILALLVGSIVPVVAVGIAFVVLFLLGLSNPTVPAATGAVGGLVVFSFALDGLARSIVAGMVGWRGRTLLSTQLMEVVRSLGLASSTGLDPVVVWAGLLVAVKVVLGALVIIAGAAVARRRATLANIGLGAIASTGILTGVRSLLLVVVQGGAP